MYNLGCVDAVGTSVLRRIRVRRTEESYTRLMDSRMSDTGWRGAPKASGSAPAGCSAASVVEARLPGGPGTGVAGTADASTSGHVTDKPRFMGQCSGRNGRGWFPGPETTTAASSLGGASRGLINSVPSVSDESMIRAVEAGGVSSAAVVGRSSAPVVATNNDRTAMNAAR